MTVYERVDDESAKRTRNAPRAHGTRHPGRESGLPMDTGSPGCGIFPLLPPGRVSSARAGFETSRDVGIAPRGRPSAPGAAVDASSLGAPFRIGGVVAPDERAQTSEKLVAGQSRERGCHAMTSRDRWGEVIARVAAGLAALAVVACVQF
jgi:hypothetical protein